MLKKDVIVEVRTNSNRLPGKVIKKILERPVIDLMIERLKKIKNIQDIILATTINKDDDIIEEIAFKNKIGCFRGSENDVLGRVVKATKQYNTNIIVEITGDNPLIDPKISESMIDFFVKNMSKYDYVSNDVGCYNDQVKFNLSLGLNVKIFKTTLLSEVEKLTSNSVPFTEATAVGVSMVNAPLPCSEIFP